LKENFVMTLCNACRLFLTHHSATVTVSTHTTKAYAADLRHFERYMAEDTDVADIRKENLRNYILDMRQKHQLKETTIKRRVACLKLFFRWARAEELTAIDPFESLRERIRLPRRLPKALAQEEISRLKVTANRGMRTSDFERLTEMIAIAPRARVGCRLV
jgi:site-specific recombinase XerD